MPSLTQFAKKKHWRVHVEPAERLRRWIKKHAAPSLPRVTSLLLLQMPKKVCEANKFETSQVWLTASGELRLGSANGPLIGTVSR